DGRAAGGAYFISHRPRRRAHVIDHHARAMTCKLKRVGASKTSSGTGHDGHPTLQSLRHDSSFVLRRAHVVRTLAGQPWHGPAVPWLALRLGPVNTKRTYA